MKAQGRYKSPKKNKRIETKDDPQLPGENPGLECTCIRAEDAFCPICVQKLLKNALKRQAEARRERDKKRDLCIQRMQEINQAQIEAVLQKYPAQLLQDLNLTPHDLNNPAKLKSMADRLRTELSKITKSCNTLAVERDKLALINESRAARLAEQQAKMAFLQTNVEQIYTSAETGILTKLHSSLEETLKWNRIVRLKLALQLFEMHRLDVGTDNRTPSAHEIIGQDIRPNDENYKETSVMNAQPRGIGKIGGLPLPHAGAVLYGAMPHNVLTSALRLVASLTSTASRVLGVSLPHPIDLRPPQDELQCDIADLPLKASEAESQEHLYHSNLSTSENASCSDHDDASSVASTHASRTSAWSIRNTITGAAAAALSKVVSSPPSSRTSDKQHQPLPLTLTSTTMVESNTPSMRDQDIEMRIRHARAAVLREESNSQSAASYELNVESPSFLQTDEFNIGLQLLQNNVVALCIHAGVPVSTLWPAEAMLLNLNALRLFCHYQVMVPPLQEE